MVTDPASKNVYALTDSSIYQFGIFNPVGVGIGQRGIAASSGSGGASLVMDPLGRHLFEINPSIGSVSVHDIDSATGATTRQLNYAAIGATAGASDAAGKYLYVTSTTLNTVMAWSITNTGLTSNGAVAASLGPIAITVDPTGKNVYVGYVGANYVSQFAINANGGLDVGIHYPTTNTVRQLAFHPTGKFLFAAEGNVGQTAGIRTYAVNDQTGGLADLGLTATTSIQGAASLMVDPSGRFLYFVTPDREETFSIGKLTGSLASFNTFLIPGGGANSASFAK